MRQVPSVETMHAPTGASGVHAVPNNGHACGELMPAMMSPHWQCCTSAGGAWSHSAARSILNRRRASHRA